MVQFVKETYEKLLIRWCHRWKVCLSLLPGLGHVEMNEGKLLLKLLWTPRGKDVVREGVDHHRTKQILSVCLEAIEKELLVKKQSTAEEYQECLTSVEDNSYLFIYQIAFSYLLSSNY